ncbi:MAG: NUDIX domain-containing protein [Candidatus Micrarchaeota archaeon]|nr:NUDIX domain-containing protein [Candidatus Micrarchaeota archaeon]
MIQRKSVGAVVFRREGRKVLYLLLHYASGHWDFVKGGVEAGEQDIDTLRRECREETGITDIAVVPGFMESIHYFFREAAEGVAKEGEAGAAGAAAGGEKELKELVGKDAVFHLAETKTKEVELSFEHKGFAWLQFSEALERLTYRNAKQVLEKADAFLNGLPKEPQQGLA